MKITIPVHPSLTLDCGTLEGEDGALPVAPRVPMDQQPVAWLDTMPAVPDEHLDARLFSQATVAVCLRWGSSFAHAMSGTATVPAVQDDERPFTETEQAELRDGLGASLKRWLEIRRDDPARHRQLAARALVYLPGVPTPSKNLPSTLSRHIPIGTNIIPYLRRGLAGFMFLCLPDGARALMGFMDSTNHGRAEAAREAAYQDPMGVLGRALVWYCWEREYEKDKTNLKPCTARPLERRYAPRQADAELRRVMKNLGGLHATLERLFNERDRSWGEKVVALAALTQMS